MKKFTAGIKNGYVSPRAKKKTLNKSITNTSINYQRTTMTRIHRKRKPPIPTQKSLKQQRHEEKKTKMENQSAVNFFSQ